MAKCKETSQHKDLNICKHRDSHDLVPKHHLLCAQSPWWIAPSGALSCFPNQTILGSHTATRLCWWWILYVQESVLQSDHKKQLQILRLWETSGVFRDFLELKVTLMGPRKEVFFNCFPWELSTLVHFWYISFFLTCIYDSSEWVFWFVHLFETLCLAQLL